MYNSIPDTQKHIGFVKQYLQNVIDILRYRAAFHDRSSLESPEKEFYDKYRPLLSSLPYNSPEYLEALKEFRPALDHHYQHNSHHPEHYEDGVNGMTLLDIVEMVVDWKAAIDRKGTGEYVLANFEATCKRFGIELQLARIIENTVINEFGWVEPKDSNVT